MSKWLVDNAMIFHYIGTFIGLIVNIGIGVAVYRKHVAKDSNKDMKLNLMWAKFVKDKNLNGNGVQD